MDTYLHFLYFKSTCARPNITCILLNYCCIKDNTVSEIQWKHHESTLYKHESTIYTTLLWNLLALSLEVCWILDTRPSSFILFLVYLVWVHFLFYSFCFRLKTSNKISINSSIFPAYWENAPFLAITSYRKFFAQKVSISIIIIFLNLNFFFV